jgi:hypothetical protein
MKRRQEMNIRRRLGNGLVVFDLLISIALILLGVDIVKPDFLSEGFGNAGVFVVSLTWNWPVVIPLAVLFLAGVVCLAISLHANRAR